MQLVNGCDKHHLQVRLKHYNGLTDGMPTFILREALLSTFIQKPSLLYKIVSLSILECDIYPILLVGKRCLEHDPD